MVVIKHKLEKYKVKERGKKMKKIVDKIKSSKLFGKLLWASLFAQGLAFGCPMIANAQNSISIDGEGGVVGGGDLGNTQLVKGTIKLINNATTILLAVEVVLCGALAIKEFIVMQQADDSEKPKHKKNIKSILISGIIVVCLTGLIKVIFSYYGVSITGVN